MVEDPVQFLKTSLKDGVVLCKLLLRLLPGSIGKSRPFPFSGFCLQSETRGLFATETTVSCQASCSQASPPRPLLPPLPSTG
ncbi:rho guanine nucleotide exchange factor 6 [Crotalus adamanteus]|uniref:Rho guanine nucleotide exchange factor 6 n=1 Tax=Crotalus adamanteus TaxID=8729 RepID=A0AAW1AUX2_CROAD